MICPIEHVLSSLTRIGELAQCMRSKAMRIVFRIILFAMMSTALSSHAIAQVNRRITTSPESGRAQPNPSPEPGPQILELRCRGGGLEINVTQGEMRQNDLWMNMTIHFQRASAAAGI